MSQHGLSSYLSLCAEFHDSIRPHPPEDAMHFITQGVNAVEIVPDQLDVWRGIICQLFNVD